MYVICLHVPFARIYNCGIGLFGNTRLQKGRGGWVSYTEFTIQIKPYILGVYLLAYRFVLVTFLQQPDPKMMQINLTGFLNGRNARVFMQELWDLLLSAQDSTGECVHAYICSYALT